MTRWNTQLLTKKQGTCSSCFAISSANLPTHYFLFPSLPLLVYVSSSQSHPVTLTLQINSHLILHVNKTLALFSSFIHANGEKRTLLCLQISFPIKFLVDVPIVIMLIAMNCSLQSQSHVAFVLCRQEPELVLEYDANFCWPRSLWPRQHV
jgi:hypothetical protein